MGFAGAGAGLAATALGAVALGSVGLTAGASAPEVLVQELIDRLAGRYRLAVEAVTTAVEDVEFKLPRALA